jgi:hypothetical protein
MTHRIVDRQNAGKTSRRAVLKGAAVFGLSGITPGRLLVGASPTSTEPSTDAALSARRDRAAGLLAGLDLPDPLVAETYRQAARLNVLAAVNDKVFPGYFSVCADGQGFGYGNSYPSLDGHQLSDALLWLGQVETVKANWDYVRSFQRPNGLLPLAILPGLKQVGGTPVDANGGFYRHWVPGDPLRALASPTYIQNADVIYRDTLDREWLTAQLPSVNLAADFLATLTNKDGLVAGAGYYMERPVRIEYDGVAQCHAADAFRRIVELNRLVGAAAAVGKYQELADRVTSHFRSRFWLKDHFAEYIHPQRGVIDRHGLTDVDWSALATGVASPEQQAVLWPRLKDEKKLYYGGMPTGIATRPETYEDWEFTDPVRLDLAAMGRVWYLECWARARMNDGEGILDTLRRVSKIGRESGYFWRERYVADEKGGCKGLGASKYCEYPANLIRIVQRFVFGVDLRLDGALALAPTVPSSFWDTGFGQTLAWRGQRLRYRMQRDRIAGEFRGASQQLLVRFAASDPAAAHASFDNRAIDAAREGRFISIELPATASDRGFEVRCG